MGQPMGKWYLLTYVQNHSLTRAVFFFEILSFADFFQNPLLLRIFQECQS